MMTLSRLKALSDSYGADLRRWPDGLCQDAEVLLRTSGEARRIMAAAAETDAMLDAMHRAEQAALWSASTEADALARLRTGVAGRIAQDGLARSQHAFRPILASLNGGIAVMQANLGWFSLATSGGLAIAGGILIGSIVPQFGVSEGVLSLLQNSPLHALPL